MATHPNILAWRISWTEEPGRLQSMGSQRAGHRAEQLTLLLYTYIYMYTIQYTNIIDWKTIKCSKEVKNHYSVLTGKQKDRYRHRDTDKDRHQIPRGQQSFLLISFSGSSIMIHTINNAQKHLNTNFSGPLGKNHCSHIIPWKNMQTREIYQ